MSRTVLPSLDGEGGSSSNELSVGKALDQAYRWLEYTERFVLYLEERSRCGVYVSICHFTISCSSCIVNGAVND